MTEPLNILVIEDSAADFLLLKRHLRQEGLDVNCHQVSKKEDLDTVLEVDDWDMVLADYNVPGMVFKESFARIKEHNPDLPIILVSGTVGEEVAVDLLKLGVWDFVLKDHLARMVPVIERALHDAQMQRAQRESEISYHDLFDSIGDSICIVGEDGCILDVNRGAVAMYGYSREYFIGKRPADMAAPGREDMQALVTEAIQKTFSGESQHFEFWSQRANGEIFPQDVTQHLGTYQGRPAVIRVVRDVTQRKAAEQQLAQQHGLLKTILESIPMRIFWKDRDLNLLGANHAFAADAGMASPDSMLGKSDHEFSWREQAELYQADDREVMEMGQPKIGYEEPKTTLDGNRIWLRTSKVPLRDEHNEIIGVLGVYDDITAGKEAENQIRRLNRLYAVLGSINETIIRNDDKQSLFSECCRIAVEQGGFIMAWIGVVDREHKKVRVDSYSGNAGDYLDKLYIKINDEKFGHGPTDHALHEGTPSICNNIAEDESMAAWREDALSAGYRSSAAFPIIEDGEVRYTFSLYSRSAGFFDEEEVHLLERLSADISYALDAINNEARRLQTETALRTSEERFERALRAANDGLWDWDLSNNAVYYSPRWKAMLGYHDDELENNFKTWEHLVDKSGKTKTLALIDECLDGSRDGFSIEYRMRHKDGHWMDILSRCLMTRDEEGKPVRMVGTHMDISDRLRLKHNLAEAQRIAHVGHWQLDLAEGALTCSDEVYRIIEIAPSEFGGAYEAFLERVHPDDRERLNTAFQNHLQHNTPYAVEHRLLLSDGRIKYILERCETTRDANGKPIRSLGTIQDITHHKEQEQQLRASEEWASLIIDSVPDTVLVVDKQGLILRTNNQVEKMFGYLPEELNGQSVNVLVPERYRHHHGNLIASYIARPEFRTMTASIALEAERHDGSLFPVEISLSPLKTNGQLQVIATIRDITERRAAEELKQRDQEQQAILRGLLETTLGGESLEETLGQCLQRLLAVSWLGLLPSGGIFLMEDNKQNLRLVATQNMEPEIVAQCARVPVGHCHCGKAAATCEMQYAHCVDDRHEANFPDMEDHDHYNLPLVSSNEAMGVLVLYLPPDFQRDPLKEQFLSSAADILAGYLSRKQSEQQLILHQDHLEELVDTRTAELDKARIEAERLSQVKSTFLATMSHEIRTPMNALLGMLELVGLHGLSNEDARMIDVARDSGKSLLRIIDDILDFSKIESGKLEINPEPASIVEMVEWTAQFFMGIASSKRLRLNYYVAPEISPAVMVDRLRLRQILNNFLSNAVKFTDHGQIDIKVDLLEHREGIDRVCLSVSDTGVGIDPELQQKLFQPFTQADAQITRRYGGTGLGLVICRRLADMMGGEIKLSSVPGQGTTLSLMLDLPVIDASLLQQARDAVGAHGRRISTREPPTVEAARTAGTLVLLVDDHPTNREVLMQQLQLLGYASEEAHTGAEVLQKLQTDNYGLLITDCHMPEMDGYQLTREIRRFESETGRSRMPVLAWTANAQTEAIAECHDAGMDDILVKPADLAALGVKLTNLLPLAEEITVTPNVAPPLTRSAPVTDNNFKGVLNPVALRKLCGGNPAMEQKMLARFYKSNRVDSEAIAKSLQDHDITAVASLAHRMKGAGRMIGAAEFALACEALEHAGKSQDWSRVEACRPDFLHALERLEHVLDNIEL